MKEFVKWVLAVLCGLFVWGIVKAFFFIMMLGSILASGAAMSSSSTPAVPKEGVMTLDLSKVRLAEQASAEVSFSMSQKGYTDVSLIDAINGLKLASEDPGVKFLLMKVDGNVSGIAACEEFREAIKTFRESGKAVIAYGVSFTSLSYYMASVADKVFTTSHHGSNIMMLGVGNRMIFVKDLLDKLGIHVQLIRHGKYKSAGEMYVRNSPSPENQEQNQEMVNSLWESIGKETAEARGISLDSLNYFINNLSIALPEDMVSHNLADETLSQEQYKEKIAALAEKDSYKDVKFIPFENYVAAKVKPNLSAKKKIAVIYANGNIVEENDPMNVSGDAFASLIAGVRADSTVKAVVFRVNSPGGTVLAASKIKEQIDALREVKPVVASYGSYAASGGYWISNSCDKIYSDATTLTGSIGVFATLPEFSGTLKDVIHVNMAAVNSHEHSDMLSLARPLDAKETAWMQTYVDDIYELFVNTVAEGRGMDPRDVDNIAQGRVWTGTDALKIGLVDEIGGLSDAMAYAAGLAGDADVASWNVVSYPKPLSQFEQILRMFGLSEDVKVEEKAIALFKGSPFEGAAREAWRWSRTWANGGNEQPFVFAKIPYVMDIQ